MLDTGVRDNHDDRKSIGQTRQYLRDFIRLDQVTDTLRQLFDGMIELYPGRANPGSLWGGVNATDDVNDFRGGPDPSMVDQEQQFAALFGAVIVMGVLPRPSSYCRPAKPQQEEKGSLHEGMCALGGADSAARRFRQSLPGLLSPASEGKIRLPGHLAADHAECPYERHPVRVQIGLVCGFAH